MPILRVFLLMTVLAGAAACGDDTPTAPTEPPPQRPTTTVPFEGVVTVNGAVTHPFNTGGSGLITVTVTALSPDSAAVLGVSLGTWNGTACQIVIANDNATQASVVIGNAGGVGSYCARVYDVGKLTAPSAYTLTVVHF
jgi:hypothetical protein